ncbi:MAG: terminase family protein [Aliishimia sp.]
MSDLSLYLRTLEERLDPTALFERVVGGPCDPWQKQMLTSTAPFAMCLASRRIGKSQTTGVLAAQTVSASNRTVLILSPTLSQSQLLFKKCLQAWHAMALPIQKTRLTQQVMELENGSAIVCVPAGTDGESARGWGVKDGGILIYEEGAFIADAVFDSTLPIREEGGRILLITTPGRKGGFAHQLWTDNDEVEKITARSTDLKRMTEKVAFDRRYMPPLQFAVEHELRWVGGGVPFFHPETIEGAFTQTPQLELGNYLCLT